MKKNSLKKKLEERLSGGKFRLYNEMLYTSTPKKIENYHTLYANQQKKWSYHPLEKIIPLINQSDLILDIGCGEGILSQKFKNVINFDLFSKINNLIKGNSNSLPFKDNVFDTAIFCLSLMSVDNTKSIKESCRVVKEKGNIIIGEIISRIVCIDKFIKNIESTGLCLIESFCDEWYFIGKFKKIMFNNQSEEIFLKPCVYKKR